MEQDVLQIVAERLQIRLGGEISLRPPPAGNRLHHAANQLPHAMLAPRGPQLATEIFRHDDVGRLLRPGAGHLDIALLEDDLAALVADDGRARLPFNLVERIEACLREEAGERQSRGRRDRFPGARAIDSRVNQRTRGGLNCLLAGTRRLVRRAILHGCLRSDLAPERKRGRHLTG